MSDSVVSRLGYRTVGALLFVSERDQGIDADGSGAQEHDKRVGQGAPKLSRADPAFCWHSKTRMFGAVRRTVRVVIVRVLRPGESLNCWDEEKRPVSADALKWLVLR